MNRGLGLITTHGLVAPVTGVVAGEEGVTGEEVTVVVVTEEVTVVVVMVVAEVVAVV